MAARIIFYGLMALIVLVLLGSLIAFRRYAARNDWALRRTSADAPKSMREYIRQTEETMDEIRTMNRQPLEIVSAEGYRLRGDLYTMNPGTRTVVVALHGYHGGGLYDMGRFLPMYRDLGFDCLIPQMRCHGESEGRYITFGLCEQVDGIAWCRRLEEIYGTDMKILLHGASMGAVTALMMCRNRMLPDTVKGCVADSAFDSMENLWEYRYRRVPKILRKAAMELMNLWFLLLANVDMKDIAVPEGDVPRKFPALFVHGLDDPIVPLTMYQSNREAWPGPASGLTVAGAVHMNSYVCRPDQYRGKFRALAEEALQD